MAMSERIPRNGREGSHSGSSDYATLTSPSLENWYSNQTHQIDQFRHIFRNQNYNNEMVETSTDQLPQQLWKYD